MQVDRNSTVLIFLLNGINSLLGWNAVLAALDYFALKFKDFNIYSFLSIPLFMGFVLVGLSYHMISNKMKYASIILMGNMIINISLLGLFLVSVVFEDETIGFVLLLVCSLFLGLGGNLSGLTYLAMINYLSREVVSKFTVGTAISGLFMIIVRSIILGIFGTEDNESFIPILIYFAIAIGFNSLNIVMNLAFCRSKVYQLKIGKFLLHKDQDSSPDPEDQADQTDLNKEILTTECKEDGKVEAMPKNHMREKDRIQTQGYFTTLKETFLQIIPYPLLILGTSIVTFILFPGPAFSRQFDSNIINKTWAIILLNLSFNLGDTTGKCTAEFKNAFNPTSLYYMSFCRFFFFLTVTFMATYADKGDMLTDNVIFPFINIFLCGFTNGFCNNASFIMSFTVCPLLYKKYAGVLCGLMLQIGLIVGTVIEVPYAYLLGIN